MEDKDITFKISMNTYKAIQQYLHNELKLTKTDVAKLIEKFTVDNILLQLESGKLKDVVEVAVSKLVRSALAKDDRWNVDRAVDKAIKDQFDNIIKKEVESKLSRLVLKDLLKEE